MAIFKNDELNLKVKVYGLEEYLEKLNELEEKLIDVKSLIEEINSMSLGVLFSKKGADDLLDI